MPLVTIEPTAKKQKRVYNYRILFPDGTSRGGAEIMSDPPTLQEIHKAVMPHLDGASHCEHVTVQHPTKEPDVPRADMFVDEMGVGRGLPRNDAATKIYRAAWLSTHPGTDPETLPAIYGPAVLFDTQVWT